MIFGFGEMSGMVGCNLLSLLSGLLSKNVARSWIAFFHMSVRL